MASKESKAGIAMPRKRAKPDDPEQSKRFIETADEVGADTDDEALERAFKKIAPSIPRRSQDEK
jgi:hypothetical protein